MPDVSLKFSDGKEHIYKDVPDDATPEQVQARAAKDFPNQQVTHIDKKPGEGIVDTAKRWAGDVGRGALTNLATLLEGAGNAHPLSPAIKALRTDSGLPVALQQPTTTLVKEATEVFPKKQEGYGTAIREGLGGWLGMPFGGATGAVSSMTAGAGTEGAKNLFGDSALSKLLGGLAGGMAGGMAAVRATSQLAPKAESLARESIDGVTPAMLEEAAAFQKAAAAKNIQVDLAQALTAVGAPAANITTIRNYLARSKHGKEVQASLEGQPGQLSMEAGQVVAGLPGNNYGVMQSANNLQQAATSRIDMAKKTRTQLWKDTLDKTKQTLSDLAETRIGMASEQVGAATQQVEAASARLMQLQKILEKASAGDAAAVARANAAVAESQKLVESLKSFSLPRGRAEGTTGRLYEEPRRGDSILNDQATREAQVSALENAIPPTVTPAASLETLQAQRAVEGAQQGMKAAEQTAASAQKTLASAEGQLASVTSVPPEAVMRAQARLHSLADQFPNTRQGAMIRSIATKMETPQGLITDPDALNRILRETAAKLKDPNLTSKGIDLEASKAISGAISDARDTLGAAFKPLKAANAAYSQYTGEVIDPLKQGPVGQFAAKGYDPSTQANMTKFESLMKEGVDINTKNSPVRVLARELAKADSSAVPDALKAYVSKNIQKAMEPGATGKTAANNPDMAQRIADSLFSNEMQAQGLRDAVAESAKSLGQNPAEMVKGLNHFMQITKALKSRPGSVGGLSDRDIFEIGGRTFLGDTLRALGFTPFSRAATRLEDSVLGGTLKKLDTILTSPDGAKLLVELGKVDPVSKRAAMLIATMAGTAATNPVGITDE